MGLAARSTPTESIRRHVQHRLAPPPKPSHRLSTGPQRVPSSRSGWVLPARCWASRWRPRLAARQNDTAPERHNARTAQQLWTAGCVTDAPRGDTELLSARTGCRRCGRMICWAQPSQQRGCSAPAPSVGCLLEQPAASAANLGSGTCTTDRWTAENRRDLQPRRPGEHVVGGGTGGCGRGVRDVVHRQPRSAGRAQIAALTGDVAEAYDTSRRPSLPRGPDGIGSAGWMTGWLGPPLCLEPGGHRWRRGIRVVWRAEAVPRGPASPPIV